MLVDWILIGEVVATQGNRGEIRVFPHTEFPERFQDMEQVKLFRQGDKQPARILAVEGCRFHKDMVILKLEGVDSINDALALKGMEIKVSPDEVVPLPEGRHYIFELIGLQVFTTDGQLLGTVTDVLQTGANDVYVVAPEPGVTKLPEILIPVIDDVVIDVDVAGKAIHVRLMDGLLE